jgi:hypothetical protein
MKWKIPLNDGTEYTIEADKLIPAAPPQMVHVFMKGKKVIACVPPMYLVFPIMDNPLKVIEHVNEPKQESV